MANSPQAIKRARQNTRKYLHNKGLGSEMRTAVKKVRYAIDAKEATKAKDLYKEAVKKLDSMSLKGIITKNKVARVKSRLNSQIKQLAESK